ncbi:hypothetical protein [Tunicatimonas pelagia]|uniref:hypothetical protein n=1 Tax=Tunicatimonas pelagia TaxID=931531 RepID=UPI002665B28B|nr:hypothetical protein [Tunicatimonas pelagia]WKN41648.1 hypothetical protein P0M28_21665 [Tunicatimonas pelagia]
MRFTRLVTTVCLAPALQVVLGLSAFPLLAQQYQYAGLFGENAYDIQVLKQQEDGKSILVLEEKQRYSKHTFHPKLGTEKWVLRDEKEKHDFTAQRTGDQIKIWGTFQGESVDKTVDIDERQWFNKLDHGLSEFAASDQQELSFWVLKLVSDLDPLKMEAKKLGTESLTIDGKAYDAVKVKLTIDNFMLSKLWSAELWYRISDGLFLRYEGANGGPGTPITIIELDEKIEG